MVVNISYLEVPLDIDKKLRDAMYLTAEPLYRNIDIEWNKVIDIVNSDYRQYSPYLFDSGIKKGINMSNDKQNLLIFDIDDGMTIDVAKERLGKYIFLLATTKSHQQEKKGKVCDRFRIILPATNIPKDHSVYFKMLELFRNELPIDEAVNHKTGSFLGNFGCEYYYNDGKIYDCTNAAEQANRFVISELKKKSIARDKAMSSSSEFTLNTKEIKNNLNIEVMRLIVDSLGYEIRGNNSFKIRDENTPSAMMYSDGGISDFGTNEHMDIFDLVSRKTGISFVDSVKYVNSFIGG